MDNKDQQFLNQENDEEASLESENEIFDGYGDEADFTDGLTDQELQALRNRMLGKIMTNISVEKKWHKKSKIIYFGRYAAILIPLILFTYLFFQNSQPKVILIETNADEIKEVILPDGSTITLNEQSSLEYKLFRRGEFKREVKIQGEALFKIAKSPNGISFSINKGEHFSIEVLGTSFNFKNRNHQHKLALMTGSVEVHLKQDTESVLLEPGQWASFNENSGNMEIVETNSIDAYSSWSVGKLNLEDEELSEVLEIIRELYELEISEELLFLPNGKSVSGTIPLEKEPEDLIKNISELFEVQLVLEENRIVNTHAPDHN